MRKALGTDVQEKRDTTQTAQGHINWAKLKPVYLQRLEHTEQYNKWRLKLYFLRIHTFYSYIQV